MDKIKFARMINLLTHWGMRELDHSEIQELDKMSTPEPVISQFTMPATRSVASKADVDMLLSCIGVEGKKIEAIKAYRVITDADLRTSKDAVERYWS